MYVAGTPGCHDIAAAESAAEAIGADLVTVTVDGDGCIPLLEEEMSVLRTANPLVLAFSAPLYLVMRDCREDTVLTGQCADEIFGGYSKYASLSDDRLIGAMADDLERFRSETLPCDGMMEKAFRRTIVRPYYDGDIRPTVFSRPVSEIRPSPGDRKKVLYDAAAELGLDFLRDRPKKAAQYGSGILDAIKAGCRREGTEFNGLVRDIAMRSGIPPFC